MNKLIGGVMIAVGLHMFGKAMYGLGELKERRKHAKDLKVMMAVLDDIIEFVEKEESKKAEEA